MKNSYIFLFLEIGWRNWVTREGKI